MHKHSWSPNSPTLIVAGAVAAILTLGACSGSSGDGKEDQFGTMKLSITDSPVTEAMEVVVQFTGVEVKARNDGAPEVFDFTTPRSIDLLALDGGGSEVLLNDVVLPAGEYEWIRLKVNAGRDGSDSYIVTSTGQHPLFIPSGNETGLKLVQGFTVGVGEAVDFTIDFDLRKSVIAPPGLSPMYLLKPALRLIDNLEVGAIAGTVGGDSLPGQIADGTCEPAVYLYAGTGVTPDDYGGAGVAPLASTAVYPPGANNVDYHYRLAFVPAGSYTVALTCDADLDDAETDDTIGFIDPQDATVVKGETTTVDFPEPATP